jgi:hypothetical protein
VLDTILTAGERERPSMRLRNWTGFGNVVCVNLLDFWIPGEKTNNIEPDVAQWEQNFFVWKILSGV